MLPNPLPVIMCSTNVKYLMPRTYVVFCAKTAMDDAWLKLVVDQEDADGRFATPEAKAANDKGRKFFADMHRKDLHDDAEWMAKQVYLNVGNFLLGDGGAGSGHGVPIEGFDAAILDAEFGLKEKGYTSLVVVPVGHRALKILTLRCRSLCRKRNLNRSVILSCRASAPGYFPSILLACRSPVSAVIIGCCCIKETLCRI